MSNIEFSRSIEWKVNGTNEWKYVGKAAKEDIAALASAFSNVQEVDTVHESLDKTLSERCRVICALGGEALPVTFSTKVAHNREGQGETHLEVLLPGKKSWAEIRSINNMDFEHRNTKEILKMVEELNAVPLVDRPKCQFRFNVFFFNLQRPIKAPWSLWAETLVHELATHVEPRLNLIERWRANVPVCWEAIGDNDEYLFQARGVPRYSHWLEQLARLHPTEEPLKTRWTVAYKNPDGSDGGEMSSHFKNLYHLRDASVPDAQKKPISLFDIQSLMNEASQVAWESKNLVTISGSQPALVDQTASKDLIDSLFTEFQSFLPVAPDRKDSAAY